MSAPSDYEKRIIAMVDSFTKTVARNFSRNLKRANPRASSVSAANMTMGTAGTITISRASSSFTHTLTYSFGNTSGTIITKTTATSVKWTPSLSLASQIPNATSGTCTITCTTYNGNTNIGSKTCTLMVSVPASVKPTIKSYSITGGGYSGSASTLTTGSAI